MERFIHRFNIATAVMLSLVIFSLNAAWGGELAPKDVVQKYYNALQKKNFSAAYQCISKGMRDDKSEGQWVELMKELFESGNVTFTGITITPGPVSGKEAQVDTVINSKDVFNKDGMIEHNVEHLVLEDGSWKIDRTELKDSKIIEP
ncbi:MAG: hypothetical protein WA140_01280 [Geobacteraceae bacterium]